MQQILNKLNYEVGSADILAQMNGRGGKQPFSEEVLQFLNTWSRNLLKHPMSKSYPDIVTFAFWIRRANMMAFRQRFFKEDMSVKGRGVAFHIAPSNVAVNYAYSLVTGLVTGNANIVRIPSKDFLQISIINKTLQETLKEYPRWMSEICLVRYGREKEINDVLSQFADTRIIWGGDATIQDLRKSPLKPRAFDICFADRYSFAVIDVKAYLNMEDKSQAAKNFYNDTYLTDQNACTSPRIVVWYLNGASAAEQKLAAELFWQQLWELVRVRYEFQAVQAVNKLTKTYLIAAEKPEWKPRVLGADTDNRLWRVNVDVLDADLMNYREHSGYFYEYVSGDLTELIPLCASHCQTIGYIGEMKMFDSLLAEDITGVDRIVSIGKTMDFDLIWDGYNLYEMLTRKIEKRIG